MRKASTVVLIIGLLATIGAVIYPHIFSPKETTYSSPDVIQSPSTQHVPTSVPTREEFFSDPKPNTLFATLYIPRLHKTWSVIEGTSLTNLAHHPAHYTWGQMPGEAGNFSIAAHRTRDYFWYLDKLRPGDDIVITVQASTIHYKVKRSFVVLPTDVNVVAANPDDPSSTPTHHYITLTTCTPKWGYESSSSSHRLVIRGEEV